MTSACLIEAMSTRRPLKTVAPSPRANFGCKACRKIKCLPVAQAWSETASRHKGIPVGSPLEGEEWLSGPYTVMAYCNQMMATLSKVQGKKHLSGLPLRWLDQLARSDERLDRIKAGGAAAEAHANALENPSRREKHQGGAVIATDADPVLARRQQEAAENGPAETEEHFVGVPLDRREILRGGGQDALEDQDPGDRQAQAGEAGEGEEGPEADQPEGMGAGEHGIQVALRRGHCCTGAAGWP